MHSEVAENKRGTFSTRQLVSEQLAQISDSVIQPSAVKTSIWYKKAFPHPASLTSQTGGLFYAEHMQLKLRSRAASRGLTQLPDSYLMWLQTDHKILDFHINPTN